MVFTSAKWVGDFPYEPPANTLVGDFAFSQSWPGLPEGERPNGKLVCASTGTTFSMQDVRERVESLARSLCHEFKWQPNEGTPWDKVVGVFSLNAVCSSTPCPTTMKLHSESPLPRHVHHLTCGYLD